MVEIISVTEDFKPNFVKPKRVEFKIDNKKKRWEVLDVYDSVAILLYHEDRDALIVVKQFRLPLYLKNRDGYTHELCAGLIDKEKSLEEIAKEEILEECGYDVPLESIQRVTEFYTAVGFAAGKQTLFYCKVEESQKVSEGGGIDDEDIEVVYLPLDKAKEFMFDTFIAKTPGLMFGFSWFFMEKSIEDQRQI